MQSLLNTLTFAKIMLAALGWIFIFALIYAGIPCYFQGAGGLQGVSSCDINTLYLAFYTSVITMFSLGYSDVFPTGTLRIFAAIEVVGGVILNGLAIAYIVSWPSHHTRRAIRACKGHWIECIDFTDGTRLYSFTSMFSDGNNLIKIGRNYQPNGSMHNTQYSGKILTNLFPTLLSIYKNDQLSTYYSDGIFTFEMNLSYNGNYKSYAGGCLDRRHGGRDRIYAKRVLSKEFHELLDSGEITEEQMRLMINRMFANYPSTSTPTPAIISGVTQTVITEAPPLEKE